MSEKFLKFLTVIENEESLPTLETARRAIYGNCQPLIDCATLSPSDCPQVDQILKGLFVALRKIFELQPSLEVPDWVADPYWFIGMAAEVARITTIKVTCRPNGEEIDDLENQAFETAAEEFGRIMEVTYHTFKYD